MRPDGAIPGCCKDVDGETPVMVATLLHRHLLHRWTLCNMFISAMGFNNLGSACDGRADFKPLWASIIFAGQADGT